MEKKFNRDHMLIQASYFGAITVIYVFGTYTLLARGVSSTQIGFCIALANMLSITLTFINSTLIDKYQKINTFNVAILASIVIFILLVINFLLNTSSIWLIINYILLYGIFNSSESLLNSLSDVYLKSGIKVNYGMGRAMGSLAYGSISIIYSFLTTTLDYHFLLGCGVILGSGIILTLNLAYNNFKKTNHKIENQSDKKEESIPYKEFISHHKSFVLTCLGYAGVTASFLATEGFTLQIVERIGGTAFDCGAVLGLKALIEVPIIFLHSHIEKYLSFKTIFIIAGISYTIKASALWLSDSLFWIYASQLLQATSFSLLLPSMVSYISKIMSKAESARGYGLQTMFTTSLSILFSAIAGMIIDIKGINYFCYIMTLTSAIFAIVLVISIGSNKKA